MLEYNSLLGLVILLCSSYLKEYFSSWVSKVAKAEIKVTVLVKSICISKLGSKEKVSKLKV